MKRKLVKNIQTIELIRALKKLSIESNVNLWKRLASELESSTRSKRVINIYKLNKYTKDNDLVIVPGKVLSVGELDHKVNVAAFSFSEAAAEKIRSNGSIMSLKELMQKNPKAKNVKILG